MSTLMFWNKQNANNSNNNSNGSNQSGDAKNGGNKKEWLHSPDTLVNGHIVYPVKFLGATPVDQAKGIETVKDAIRRLQFSQQIKKAEGNGDKKKSHKVELTISVNGVTVQEPRVQKVLHQFPLHDISYCADEKGVKKFFSFIAKTSKKDAVVNGDTITNKPVPATEDLHTCFVFISSKLASDITMTIGQAFELAYRRYVSDGSKGTEASKLHAQNKQLENSVQVYQQRLKDLVELLPKAEVSRLLGQYGVRDMLEVPATVHENGNGLQNGSNGHKFEMGPDMLMSSNDNEQLLIETSSTSSTGNNNNSKLFAPLVPPRNQLQNQINSTLDAFKPSVGTKLEGLLLHSDSDSDFDPRADESDTSSSHTNGGSGGGNGQQMSNDLFGFEPSKTLGQQLFTQSANGNGLQGLMNGTNGGNGLVNGNGNGFSVNSPVLLAPPPKTVAPRRPTANNSNIISNNGSQDLFGSTPFNAIQPSPFDDDDVDFGRSATSSGANTSASDAFEDVRNSSTVFPRVATALSNPFGDANVVLNATSHSAFDDSFDRGFEAVPAAAAKAADPFAALATSSPATAENSLKSNSSPAAVSARSTELSGINFSASIGSPPETKIENTSAALTTPTANKPNYHAFYTLSEVSAPLISNDKPNEKAPAAGGSSVASSMDIFQSVAASAFQQFGNAIPSGAGFAGVKKSADTAAPVPIAIKMDLNAMASKSRETSVLHVGGGGAERQNNFNTKTMAFDDFTLESLDPLRK